jgi:SsrA-binding protein
MTAPKKGENRPVATNKKVSYELEVEDRWEAGIVLTGSEVKVLRQGKCVLQGAHARVIGHEAFAIGIQIPEYPWSHQFNHDPTRQRKLLLHAREILKLEQALKSKGTTAVISRVYFVGSRVKVEVSVGTGKKLHDKRDSLKEKQAKRDLARVIR